MSVLGNAKFDSHRKTHKVEPDGTGRKYMFLLGEASQARVSEESAEAIVAMTLAERQEERRAEESRKRPSPNLNKKARRKRSRAKRRKPVVGLSYPPKGRREPLTESTDKVQRASPATVGRSAKPDKRTTANAMATIHHGLVELLQVCQLAKRG